MRVKMLYPKTWCKWCGEEPPGCDCEEISVEEEMEMEFELACENDDDYWRPENENI